MVESSALVMLGYDPECGGLYVKFKNRSTYRYDDVTGEQWRRLIRAPSHGAALQTIKANHMAEPMPDAVWDDLRASTAAAQAALTERMKAINGQFREVARTHPNAVQF